MKSSPFLGSLSSAVGPTPLNRVAQDTHGAVGTGYGGHSQVIQEAGLIAGESVARETPQLLRCEADAAGHRVPAIAVPNKFVPHDPKSLTCR